MSITIPTIGRKVWFYKRGVNDDGTSQAFDATIVYVWSERCVNLVVFDYNG